MKRTTLKQIEIFLSSLKGYDLKVPVALHDGTRVLGGLDEGELMLHSGRIPTKPTSVFFPQNETILVAEGDKIMMQKPLETPLFVVGFTAEDANCLSFVDRFFGAGRKDDIYFNKRDGAVTAVLSGYFGVDGALMKLSDGNCDLEFVQNKGGDILVLSHSDKGAEFLIEIAGDDVADDALSALREASDALPDDDQKTLEKASALLLAKKVPDSFWAEMGDRCISCTLCNLACPTCTCFDIYDHQCGDKVERCRMWDSCQLDGFMREASGHNPLGTEWRRTRRRIHHKLAADVKRWGFMTCMLCGRCDDVCPVNIGIVSISREMVKRYA
ncbi:MAG: 4Fe-4S dicluster domain-containing protein [Alphaproteobacteria bacterium]